MYRQEQSELGVQGRNENVYGTLAAGSDQDDERQLIASAKEGSEQAFAALFNMHKRRVYTLCLHMSKDTAKAEDLTQDAFMRVFRKLHTFRGEAKFSTWLYRIALNTVLANFRKGKSEALSVDTEIRVDSTFVRPEVGRSDAQLLGVIDRITLLRAIEELPPGCRTIFILHDVEGYEHHEVADLLECSVGNSKAQLHKARRKIRSWLLLPGSADARSVAAEADQQGATRARTVSRPDLRSTGTSCGLNALKA
jgi:RNA polymerase sigma-70 factor (ECF subfamily)